MKYYFIMALFFSSLFSDKLDINNCNLEELSILPLSEDKVNEIYLFVNYEQIQTIYDLLEINNIDISDVHLIRDLIQINSKEQSTGSYTSYSYDTDEANQSIVPHGNVNYRNSKNINFISYDQLSTLKSVSPIDVSAVLKQQNKGEIKSSFELKNSPGLSRYGYKNLKYFYYNDQADDIPLTNFDFESFINTNPSIFQTEESGQTTYYGMDNPSTNYRMRLLHGNFSIGHSRFNNTGDPQGVYTNKLFISLEDLYIKSSHNFKIDYLILGNFKASFGQGLVMTSGDRWRSRDTGYKFSKRVNGISPDNQNSEGLTLNGIGFQMSNKFFRISLFKSEDTRDAVINEDGSFTSLIFMRPRLGFGVNNNSNFFYENMIDALTEQTRGANIRISFNEGTNLGFTYYQSLYDRELNPQILESITGGDPEYSGDDYYLKKPESNSCDSEVEAMYSSSDNSDNWADAKSSRRITGINFNTVIENISLQFEYARMNNQSTDGISFKFDDYKPSAFIANIFMQFNNLDIMLLHRDYDLHFDNPYQKSFSEYRRYKSSIFEDEYWLEDPILTSLHSLNPQPQAEKGTYLESRYQFHKNFVLGLQWDNWIRKADNAKYFRLLTKLEWRPLFNYRIYFRYKLQSRGSFSISHPSPYFIKEARIRLKLRLSNYSHLQIFYSWNSATFSPRPRLTGNPNPFINGMNIGNIGTPDESIGFDLKHNINTKLELYGGAVYAHGFLWYFDASEFSVFENEFGLINMWLLIGYKFDEKISLSFRVSHSIDFPSTTVVGGTSATTGAYIDDTYIMNEKMNFRAQINYRFKN